MTKHFGAVLVIVCGFLTLYEAADAAESDVPEPFRGFDESSNYAIYYDDLTYLLGTVVVDVGRSNRRVAKPPADITGTRMKAKVKKTANEGNRFNYESFRDNEVGRQFLRDIQDGLQQFPAESPLENFTRDEQLAYWLNLYNITVLNEIVAVYPKRSLKKLFRGKNSIYSKKLLTVAGISLSLNDIQFTILKQNYDSDPLIIYGLYQGIIGGPDIRTVAYTGATVYRDLEDNARDFVNSNRGTFGGHKNTFRVSSLYDRNRAYFPEFDSELPQHLMLFLQGSHRTKLEAATKIKPDINDWTVTDLGGTRNKNIGGSLASNSAAMLDSFRGEPGVNGGVMVAGVIIKRQKRAPQDDADMTAAIESLPDEVQGARVEEISTEITEPTE
ncbi:MAG: DUF547 domain-containing protein [Calditrichaeota bacterium]|nr:DUF547 domain-containing protein [Calditrichota bacterium]